ncbi:MAG: hypothetical protein ABJA94_11890, partial [Rhodoglobus sp.]
VGVGTPLPYGEPWPGWSSYQGPEQVDLSNTVLLVTIGQSSTDEGDFINSTFEGWALSDKYWIDADGRRAEPCVS